ncbi:HTH-type transcriptional regulator YofA [Roseovarius albus]|uniref:HTH-type transcriptional regulator YofA n=1 Tax=Roseovarius albus TaxID=1247867 RepID=A0A1X6ZKQ8_9RHOB|nr:LysR family transcriptional regulator [Roseovarius albus]SLN52300.1 HTH-type transcriptional regulator YofA [Roseovarius albus]
MHSMHWDDLRYLLAIKRAGSLSHAANTLGINQSTVSRRIVKREKQLNVKLLERRPEGAILSEAGLKLCALAESTESELQFLLREIAETELTLSGPLVIACVDMLIDRFLAPHLAEFQAENPNLNLSVLAGLETVDLMRGKADVALRVSQGPDENLVGRRLCDFGLGIYGAADRGDADVLDWIDWPDGRWFNANIPKHLKSRPVKHYTDSFLSMNALVRTGMGMAVLPCYWADCDPALKRIYPTPVSHQDLGLWLLYHPDKKQSPRLRAFIDFISPIVVAHSEKFAGSSLGTKSL